MVTLLKRILLLTLSISIIACQDFNDDNDGSYVDDDGDGFGSRTPTEEDLVNTETLLVSNNSDCNDDDPYVNPNAVEVADGYDNNCNSKIDDDVQAEQFFADFDGDGFGDPGEILIASLPRINYVRSNTDCDDSDPFINLKAIEILDSVDNDCDNRVDEGFVFQSYYLDKDKDNYGKKGDVIASRVPPDGFVEAFTDCNDKNARVNPSITEITDGIDNNCDGRIDETNPLLLYYRDGDNDNYGDPAISRNTTFQPEGFVKNNADCNDENADINPSKAEAIDGIDNNCNGILDERL